MKKISKSEEGSSEMVSFKDKENGNSVLFMDLLEAMKVGFQLPCAVSACLVPPPPPPFLLSRPHLAFSSCFWSLNSLIAIFKHPQPGIVNWEIMRGIESERI